MDAQKTILIIEDDRALREALCDKVSREGFTVLQAEDGARGLAIAREKHPDLVVLDIVMPVMDGIAVLRSLREDEWGKRVPVFMLTNLDEDAKVAEAIELGSYEYFVKSERAIEEVILAIKDKLLTLAR